MLTDSALTDIEGLRHGFFTRQGGVSAGLYSSLNCGPGSGDDPEAVKHNRAMCAEALGVEPDALLSLSQRHTAEAVIVTEPWDSSGPPDADAMVTHVPGLALGILTADCVPVLFANDTARVIAAAHAGWKGALGGILQSTLDAMARLRAAPEDTLAVIGPCIGQASYEVDDDFRARFEADDPTNERFFIAAERTGHCHFDLPGYVRRQLEAAGVGKVRDLGLDTRTDPDRFFSYRRTVLDGDSDYGRQISAIALTAAI